MTRRFMKYGLSGIALSLVCSVLAVAAKPLPDGKDVFTDRQFRQGSFDYHIKRVDDYRQQTTDPEAVRDRAAQYIGEVMRQALIVRDDSEWKTLRDQGQLLRKEGATDPLVGNAYALAVAHNGDGIDKEKAVWKDVLKQFENTEYPAAWQLGAATRLANLCRNRDPSQEAAAMKRAGPLVLALLKAEHEPESLRHVWHELSEFLKLADINQEKEIWEPAVKAKDEIHPWLWNLWAGNYHIDLGWHFRGTGFAYKVTPEGWEKLHENLKLAEEHLEEAYRLLPDAPEAASRMISVAKTSRTELSPREWFDRAVAAQFDYMPAYDALLNCLLPRWGGSYEAMLDFGKECAATNRFDTSVPWLMIVVIEGAGKDIDAMRSHSDPPKLGALEAEEIWRRNGHYDLARPVLLGYAAEPNSPLDKQFVQTLHLWIAVNAASWGDGPSMAEARELADALGDDYVPTVLSSRGSRPKFMVSRIYAMTGPAAADCVRGDRMIYPPENREIPGVRKQAFDLYVQAEKETNDPRAAVYFKARKAELEVDLNLEAGGWVDIVFEPEFTAWYHHAGEWTWEDERTVVGASKAGGPLFLRLNLFSQPPLEFEFDMEQLPTGRQQSPLGLRIGRVAGFNDSTRRGRMFWANPGTGEGGITECPAYPKYMAIEKKMDKKRHMHVRVWPDHHEFYIDGKSCEYVPPTTFDAARPYVLGSMPWIVGTSKARFSNLRIRKLAYGPPPALEDLEGRVAYYSRLINDYPDYARPRFLRGLAYYYQKEYEKAMADFQAAVERGRDTANLDLMIGVTWLAKGNYEQALTHLQRQVAATPDEFQCLRVLAYFLATCPEDEYRDGKKAVELAEAACKAAKEPPWDVLLSLAVAYAEVGDFEKAIPLAKQSLDAAPADEKERLAKVVALLESKQPYRDTKEPAEQDSAQNEEADSPSKADDSPN